MLYEKIKNEILKIKKGTFHAIAWERPCKTKKAFNNNVIIKRTIAVVRFGVEYDNISAVIQKRQNGILPTSNAGLQWGQWLLYPYFIQHKNNIYLRCTIAPRTKKSVIYYLNGSPVHFNQVKNMLLASEKNNNVADVFNINIDNVIQI